MLVFMRGEDRHWQIAISSIIVAFSLLMIVVTIMSTRRQQPFASPGWHPLAQCVSPLNDLL